MEKWKDVYIEDEKTNYQISNHGRCRNVTRISKPNKGILKPKCNKKTGYEQYQISVNGIRYYLYVHRLVAQYFIPNNDFSKNEVNHKDGNKQNNLYTNLEWVNKQENMKHAFENRLVRGTQKPVNVFSLKGEFISQYDSISHAYRSLGLPVCWNSNFDVDKRQSYGFQFRFEGDNTPVIDITKTCKYFSCGLVKLTKDGEFIKEYETMTEAYTELGVVNNGAISQVCKGKRKTYKGFKWAYSRDYFS